MIVGFTGTQEGMTDAQYEAVRDLLVELAPDEGRHGDCVGADDDFDGICHELGIPVVIHPPSNPRKRAFCKGARKVMPEKDYIPRNRDIVNASTVLIGTPKDDVMPTDFRGQGTWSTINYANKVGNEVYTFAPDGRRI